MLKKYIAVLNFPKSYPEPAGGDRGGVRVEGGCSPYPECHSTIHLLSSILYPLSAISELTADIYFAYLISFVGFTFYSQLRPMKASRCTLPHTASHFPPKP